MAQEETKRKHIVFLYTELAAYTLACLKKLEKKAVDIHVFRWPVNKEAPFDFNFSEKIKVYDRHDYSRNELLDLVKNIQPDLIYCSGWIDKHYLTICSFFKTKIPIIVGFDNQWKGSVKQVMASFLNKILVRKYFTHAWIPGDAQKKFAHKLGFKAHEIITGVYSADTDLFESYYLQNKTEKEQNLPHRFIYMGRYVEWKGINELWEAFKLLGEERKDWELWCVGTGEMYENRLEIPGLVHKGFIQPDELKEIMTTTSVFILPSKFEPWGVALHEFAAAGFPLICTSEVGASSAFLNEGENGWYIKSGDVNSIYDTFKKVIATSDEDLVKFGKRSRELAKLCTTDMWAETIFNLCAE